MEFSTILCLLFVLGLFILLVKKLRDDSAGKKRRTLLNQAGQVSTWQEVERSPARFSKFLEADFGFGTEIWASFSADEEIDNELQAFKSGLLILPRPQISDVQSLCQINGVLYTLRKASVEGR